MKLVDVLNEGKKVARLVANRDLDPKNVKQKKESLKKCGVLTPAVIVNGYIFRSIPVHFPAAY